ncbi:MAG: site-specific integrase, partial [Betaproteobacteria bacterium]|nr:site-specific integrase [Betaproteobacteria bacterium]
AKLVSAQGLHGPVDIEKLRLKFERLTPALLGMKTDNALAAFKSNLRRALRLAGHDIMPGRHVTPLSPEWSKLVAMLNGAPIAIKLSRFAHVASEQGWEPEEITPVHLVRFGTLLRETNLTSKADKLVRGTVAAWAHGRRHCPDWPSIDLGAPPAETRFYALPWSAFPTSFAQDVEEWLARPAADLGHLFAAISKTGSLPAPPSSKGRNNGTLRARTKSNYRDALRRAASILVRAEHRRAEDITGLAAVIGVAELQCVLRFLSERTDRQEGGHLGYIAFLFYFIARDHLRLPGDTVAQLEYLWSHVRGRHGEMSPRSFERLCQFDDDAKTINMALLPKTLAKAAHKRGKIDEQAVKLMRTALFTAIAVDTGLRVGNIVNLQLDKHVTFTTRNKQRIAIITNPGEEVKNGRKLISELLPETTKLLDVWLVEYRSHICPLETLQAPYLFPNQSGGHMPPSLALQSLKDLAAYHAGLDVTPHVTRAYIGKLLLDENPDAHAAVQAVLGHNSIETTLRYYAPVRPMNAKRRAQRLLLAKQEQPTDKLATLKGQRNDH